MVGEAMKSNPEMEPKPVLQYFQFFDPTGHRSPLPGVKPIGIREVAKVIVDYLTELSERIFSL